MDGATPRLGLRMVLPASVADVEWFGAGPGESYVDSARRPASAVRANGRRPADSLRVSAGERQSAPGSVGELRGPDGGIRIEGDPTFELTVRRWTTEDLDAARHPTIWRARRGLRQHRPGQNGSAPHRADPACCRSTSCPPRRRPGPCGCGPRCLTRSDPGQPATLTCDALRHAGRTIGRTTDDRDGTITRSG